MRTSEQVSETNSPFKKVATGLYRYIPSGTYFAHVRVHGKLFRESLQTDDRKTADRKLRDFKRDKEKIDHKFSRSTLADLLDRYEKTILRLSPATITKKKAILKRIRKEWPQGKNVMLSDIKPSHCEIWLSKQAERVRASHVNAHLTVLRDVLRFAVRDGWIANHPCQHVKYSKREKPIRLTPTWDDFKAIVENIREQQFNADAQDSANFVEFIGLAGLGQAEVRALKWTHVDLDRGVLTVFRKKTRTGFTVPIFPQLRPLLEKLHAERRDGEERVLRISDAKKAIAGACTRLRLPAYSHRSFRRMFITRAIELGIDVKVVAEWQGHQDGGKLILDTYSHVNRVHSQRMAQLMIDGKPDNVVTIKSGQAA